MQGKLPVKKLHPDAKLPTRTNPGDAGLDLYTLDSASVEWGDKIKLPTGIAIAIPEEHVGLILDRSSMGSKGISRLAGVIDSPYRGEILVVLANVAGDGPIDIQAGDKVAQLLVIPIALLDPQWVEELDETDRGTKGFGSSGR